MAGINLFQFKYYVVMPTLQLLAKATPGMYSPWAINQVTGTGLVESGLADLKQLGGGPALGVCQMEPATHDSLWDNYIKYHPELQKALQQLVGDVEPSAEDMVGNLDYAAAMCRVKYWDSSLVAPAATDAVGCAQYHKTVYNTALGAANVAVNTPLFQQAIDA